MKEQKDLLLRQKLGIRKEGNDGGGFVVPILVRAPKQRPVPNPVTTLPKSTFMALVISQASQLARRLGPPTT